MTEFSHFVHAEPDADSDWAGLQPYPCTWRTATLNEARLLARKQAKSPGWARIWYGSDEFDDDLSPPRNVLNREPCWSVDRPNEFRYPADVGDPIPAAPDDDGVILDAHGREIYVCTGSVDDSGDPLIVIGWDGDSIMLQPKAAELLVNFLKEEIAEIGGAHDE